MYQVSPLLRDSNYKVHYIIYIGLQIEADRVFIHILVIILVNTAAVSLAFFISAVTGVFVVANALITTLFVLSLVRYIYI